MFLFLVFCISSLNIAEEQPERNVFSLHDKKYQVQIKDNRLILSSEGENFELTEGLRGPVTNFSALKWRENAGIAICFEIQESREFFSYWWIGVKVAANIGEDENLDGLQAEVLAKEAIIERTQRFELKKFVVNDLVWIELVDTLVDSDSGCRLLMLYTTDCVSQGLLQRAFSKILDPRRVSGWAN